MSEKSAVDPVGIIEADIGYYDMPETQSELTVTGSALVDLLDEVKRWRQSHASEGFNPDYCAAKDALKEHLALRASGDVADLEALKRDIGKQLYEAAKVAGGFGADR